MITEEIRHELLALQDEAYRVFSKGLFKEDCRDRIIGVRTPALKAYAKELAARDNLGSFLNDLPHTYFEEDQLHAFIISGMKDFAECVRETEHFLPYVDNWATCDQMIPKVFAKHKQKLLPLIDKWLMSGKTYTVRFGIKLLMEHFLDADFDVKYAQKVAGLRSDEYYVNMMIAWYFATALAKQYDATLPFIEKRSLDRWTHNKAIQKAIESRRVSEERKAVLRGMKY